METVIANIINALKIRPRGSRSRKTSREPVFDDESYTIAVLGGAAVGKTSLLRRFFYGSHNHKHNPTIEDLYKEKLVAGNQRLEIDIIDTTGSENFPAMRRLAIQRAHVIIIVFALNNTASFTEMKNLRNEVLELRTQMPPVIIVGNKADTRCDKSLELQRQLRVRRNIIENEMQHKYVECSARNGENVSEVFEKYLLSELQGSTTAISTHKKSSKKGLREFHKKIKRHF
ncbi:GTP-binding protein Di-Ras1-like [Lineus longissimus]|uniref:GTP-binding protein Di-Ras1-like n=1 Tax=Lineus longissimus TaxID=88925 RepID=UPI00315D0F8F